MALSPIGASATPKHISLTGNSTVMYTVPVNKRFVGYIWSGGTEGVAINGVITNTTSASVLFTLYFGAVVGALGNNNVRIIGYEEDA
jgi:hypothetical protein